jgi:hypothetical protein
MAKRGLEMILSEKKAWNRPTVEELGVSETLGGPAFKQYENSIFQGTPLNGGVFGTIPGSGQYKN